MINLLSIRIANFLCKKGVILEDEKEIYVYGYELLISSFFGVFTTLILGMILGRTLETLLFLFVFIITRQRCGGFHANHFITCILTFLLTYLSVMFLSTYLLAIEWRLLIILMLILYGITIFRFAPMEHKNKPLSEDVKKTNRIKSIQLSILWIGISLITIFFKPIFAIIISLTLASIAMFMLFASVYEEVKTNEE